MLGTFTTQGLSEVQKCNEGGFLRRLHARTNRQSLRLESEVKTLWRGRPLPTIKAAARRQSALGVSTVECREPRMEYNDIHSDDGQRRGSPRGRGWIGGSGRRGRGLPHQCLFQEGGWGAPSKKVFSTGHLKKQNVFHKKIICQTMFKQPDVSSCCDRSPVLTDMQSLKRRG